MKKNSKLHNILSRIVESAPSLRGRAGGEAVLLLLISVIFAFTSCNDSEEGEYTLTNSIRIVSQNVSDMPVKASEGTIVVEAPSAIDATASSDWFTTSVSGKTITVKTTDNTDLEYRSGKITVRCGSDVTEVAVIQKGAIVSVEAQSLYLDDAKADFQIPYVTNLDFKCYTAEDWITCKAQDGVLSLGVAENATGHMRSGYVFYEAGSVKDSIFVQQCEIAKDLLGEMQLVYYNAKIQDYSAIKAEFVASTDTAGVTSYAIVLNDYGFIIPVDFKEKTNTITLNAGQYVGKFQEYYIYTMLYDANNGGTTTNDKAGVSGSFFYDKDDDATYLEFEDNGTWGEENKATSLILTGYDKDGNSVGNLLILHFPYLMK